MKRKKKNWAAAFVAAHDNAQDERLRQYYATGMVSGDCLLSQAPLVALDFETTGLNPEADDIISIGLVPFTLQRIIIREAAEWVVKPTQPLAEDSVIIHGITHNEVKPAPDLDSVLAPLFEALAGHVVVVHHRAIECSFLHQALIQRLNESISFPVIDTFTIEKHALQQRQGLIGRIMKKPLGSLRLTDCRRRYSLPYYKVHHALTDAVATAELFQAQASYHFRDDTRVGDIWY